MYRWEVIVVLTPCNKEIIDWRAELRFDKDNNARTSVYKDRTNDWHDHDADRTVYALTVHRSHATQDGGECKKNEETKSHNAGNVHPQSKPSYHDFKERLARPDIEKEHRRDTGPQKLHQLT